jgi:serine/threonine-protein kinase
MLKPGATLDNRYRIESIIGRGGFGFVYCARERLTGEVFAIKELVPGFVDDAQTVQRFIQEARATLRLTHSHIARTYTIFEDRGTYYLAMEYLPGGSLEDRLKQGPLPMKEVVGIAVDLCEALAYAHDKGVVHCDIKPANVLFDEEGEVRLGDFGIAYVSAELMTRPFFTAPGTAMGTVRYMAPEQLEGVRDDVRVDVYAVGALIYEMIAGRPYLDFDTDGTPGAQARNITKIQRDPPLPLKTVSPEVPEQLARVIGRALRKAPDERFATAGALKAALLLAIQPQEERKARKPVPPRPSPSKRESPPVAGEEETAPALLHAPRGPLDWLKRMPAWGRAVGALALVALLIGGVVWAQRAIRGNRAAAPPATATTQPASTPTATPLPTATTEVAAAGTDAPPTETPQPTETVPPRTPTVTPVPPTSTLRPSGEGSGAGDTEGEPSVTPPSDTPPADADAGDTWTRPTDGATMVYVPPGPFQMGSTDAQYREAVEQCVAAGYPRDECEGLLEIEKPAHTQTVGGFWIDKYPVTNAQFAAFLNERGNQSEGAVRGVPWFDLKNDAAQIERIDGEFQARSGYEDHPVTLVSWYGARAYAEWVGGRLPTEREWEKAARGPDGWVYPWGDEPPTSELCNFDNTVGETTSVRAHSPAGDSPYGCADMAGNVWEWTRSLWGTDLMEPDYVYPYDPDDGRENLQAGDDVLRVLRGGDFSFLATGVRCAVRGRSIPFDRWRSIGFRVLVSPANGGS